MSRQVFPTTDPRARKAITSVDQDKSKSYFQPIYDYQVYPAAGTSALAFFGTPYTQRPGGLDDTNMLSAGQLSQRSFECTAIEVLVLPGVTPAAASAAYVADAYELFRSGRLEFRVNNEVVLMDGPVGMFGCPSRLYAEGVQYAAAVGPMYRITNIVIPAQTNFSVDLKWNALVPISANARIGVRLMGVESRRA